MINTKEVLNLAPTERCKLFNELHEEGKLLLAGRHIRSMVATGNRDREAMLELLSPMLLKYLKRKLSSTDSNTDSEWSHDSASDSSDSEDLEEN